MDKKIVLLLTNNLRVIIPDFGAFIIRQQEPLVVVFNELLRNNDGLLLEYIMKAENVEKEVAEELLSEYTKQANRVLESGKILTIEGLGILQKDKSGSIIFTQADQIITLDDTQKIETDVASAVLKKDPPTIKQENAKVDQPNIDKPIDRVHEEFIPNEKSGSFSLAAIKSTLLSIQVAKWIIIILSLNLAIFLFFMFKDNVRDLFRKNKGTSVISASIQDQLADSVKAAASDSTLIFSESTQASKGEDAENSIPGNLRYYIVAGCFRDEINADELVDSLKKAGYNAEKFGMIGDLYAVSFASFDDKDLAQRELSRIREEFHPDAWMTRF